MSSSIYVLVVLASLSVDFNPSHSGIYEEVEVVTYTIDDSVDYSLDNKNMAFSKSVSYIESSDVIDAFAKDWYKFQRSLSKDDAHKCLVR